VILVPNPSKQWRDNTNSLKLPLLNFAVNLLSQAILGCHLEFHIFFLQAPHFFYSWLFWTRLHCPAFSNETTKFRVLLTIQNVG